MALKGRPKGGNPAGGYHYGLKGQAKRRKSRRGIPYGLKGQAKRRKYGEDAKCNFDVY